MKPFQIENKDGKVKLNDLVTKWSADEIIQELGKLFGSKAVEEGLDICGVTACAENAMDTLEIEINTPGGSVLDGHRIYQELRAMRDRGVFVVAKINSLAASMGSVIAMAADEIRMVKGGRMMIHEASQMVHGTAKDHLRAANLLESMTGEIAEIYANRSGQPLENVREMMADETWLGADEAHELGFVDAVLDGDRVDTKEETKATAPPTTMFGKTKDTIEEPDAQAVQISQLEEQIEALTTEKTAAEASAQEAADQLLQAKEINARLEEESTEKDVLLNAADTKIAEQGNMIAELTEAVKPTEEKVAAKAAAELATIGVEPAEETAAPATMTREEFNAKWNAIADGKERSKWYLANKHLLAE